MTRQRIIQIIKYLWIFLVFIGAIFYLIKNYEEVLITIKIVTYKRFFLSIFLLFIGKFFLVQVSQHSIDGQPWQPKFGEMLYINSINQLAKYLPGGIWHFVGRMGVYKNNGLTGKQIGRVMIVENLWLLSSAAFVGGMFSYSVIFSWLNFQTTLSRVLIWIGLLFGLWLITFFLIDKFASLQRHSILWIVKKPMLFLAIAWIFIGLSFGVLFPINKNNILLVIEPIGAFALSWAIGFAAIFAPSGLGIREAGLSYFLRSSVFSKNVVIYGVLVRIIWVLVELVLGLITELVYGSGKLNHLISHMNKRD